MGNVVTALNVSSITSGIPSIKSWRASCNNMLEYESFSVYGFHVVYPTTWKIEFDPKSDRLKGDVAFKSPEKENIFLSWGSLEKAKKRYSSLEEHANDSIDRIKKNPRVRKVETSQTKDTRIQSHKALFSLVKVTFSTPSLLPFTKTKEEVQEVRCMHLHCETSERYYVIYGAIALSKSQEHEAIFNNMMKSFKCHSQ